METARPRDLSVQRVILIEGSANVLVLAAKLSVGLTTGSLAIMADAVHSLTDVINNIVAWVVIRISAKPADREHPYGHRKFEGLAVFVLATLLAVLAFEIATRALTRGEAEPIVHGWGVLMMLGVLGVNIALSIWQRHWALRLESDILLADASHTFSDVMTTVVVIVGWQLSARGLPWLDTICALGVAGLVMYLAFSLFRRVVPVLVDEMAIPPEKLAAAVRRVPGVLEVRRVRSRWVGPVCAVDLVVAVPAQMSTRESHGVADQIESVLEAEFGVHDITIHVEPKRV